MSLLSRLTGWFRGDAPESGSLGLGMTPEDVERILRDYKEDITRLNLITLGREFSQDDIRNFRMQARLGDPRRLYAMMDEWMRFGPAPQKAKAVEAMKGASAQFVTTPEDWDDDSSTPEGADPREVAEARAARDFLEDTLSPHLCDLTEVHADEFFYGIADSKIVLDPRGNSNRWDAIAEIQAVPARRHRLDMRTHEWLLMPSPDAFDGKPIKDLLLRPDGGTEGLFFTEIGAGAQHLDQRGLFFQCLAVWNIYQYLARWRAKRTELYGVTPRVGYVNFNNPDQVAQMNAGLRDMGATSYMVAQLGTKIDFPSPPNIGTGDPLEAYMDWCERQFDNRILGHSQMTGVQKGVGGKMQGDTAVQQFEELTNSRLRTLGSQITRGLGKTLVARNRGAEIARRHPPQLRLRFVQKDDPSTLADIALKAKQAGWGTVVAAEDLAKRCTLKVAGPGDKNLGPADSTAPTGAPQQTQMLSRAESDRIERELRALMQGSKDRQKKMALAWARRQR